MGILDTAEDFGNWFIQPPGSKKSNEKVQDVLAKDETTTVRALVAKYWPANEKTAEGQNARQVAVAIVGAESGGDTDVVNTTPCSAKGDHAVGLFQICSPMHMPVADAKNPTKNVAKARQIYLSAGKTFARDWEAYTNGSYKQYLNWNKTITIRKRDLNDVVYDNIPGAKEVGSVVDFLGNLVNPSFYARLGKGMMGVVLIFIGVGAMLFIVIRPALGLANNATNLVSRTQRIATKMGRPAAEAAEAAAAAA